MAPKTAFAALQRPFFKHKIGKLKYLSAFIFSVGAHNDSAVISRGREKILA
ncbi:MAG: hypothetical protein ACI3VA_06930 [Candidatus Limivicinus sp.]